MARNRALSALESSRHAPTLSVQLSHCLAYLADFARLTGGSKSGNANSRYAESGRSRVPAPLFLPQSTLAISMTEPSRCSLRSSLGNLRGSNGFRLPACSHQNRRDAATHGGLPAGVAY